MKNNLLSILLTALLALPAYASTAPITATNSTDGILAQVNDEVILKSELINASVALANEYHSNNVKINPEQIQQQALNTLITRKLQLGIINRLGFSPDENAINRQLTQMAQAQGFDSLSDFQKTLDTAQAGSYANLRKQVIEEASLVALWQAQVAPRIKISDQEVEMFLSSPEGSTIATTKTLIPEWQTSHILASIDATHTEAMAEQKINTLYAQLQQGADFKNLAATYSDDLGSATQNGSLGWVSEGQMVKEFENVMKNTEKGDFSAPFRSQFGWHILKIDNTRERDVSDQQRKNTAREVLFGRMAPQAEEDWIQELRAAAYIKIFE